jgi:formate--tetrahydrofolate ligase
MLSDIEIAQAAELKPIQAIAKSIGFVDADLIPYGHHIAKLSYAGLSKLQSKSDGKLIRVSDMAPLCGYE